VAAYAQAQTAESALQSLYDGHHWFELRDAVRLDAAHGAKAPLFYKAAVEAAFHEARAEADLKAVITAKPAGGMEYEARELLIGLYFRAGKYQEALTEAKSMLAEKPGAADIKNMAPTLEVLAAAGDQRVIAEKPAPVSIDIEDGNIVLPLTINGVKSHYIFDNGFSLSGMSEAEAKRLKLTVRDVKTNIDTMSGAAVTIRIAVARKLVVAGLRLENVAFYVLPGDQPPFNGLRAGRQGILGLPVILAMRQFEWSPGERRFSRSGGTRAGVGTQVDLAKSNLAFDGTSIFNRVNFEGKPVDFSLDTGAEDTELYLSFARRFPKVVAEGKREAHKVTGVGGSAEIDSVTLPSLTLVVGGKEVVLRPAHVLLKDNNSTTSWFVGNLGMDLLQQGRSVAVDFGAMTLVVR
jgi:predicted aspartyl protease